MGLNVQYVLMGRIVSFVRLGTIWIQTIIHVYCVHQTVAIVYQPIYVPNVQMDFTIVAQAVVILAYYVLKLVQIVHHRYHVLHVFKDII